MTEAQWTLTLAYDYRFGTMAMIPTSPEGKRVGVFQVRVADLIRQAGIKPHELRAYLEDAKAPEVPIRDMEEFRQEAIRDLGDLSGKVVLDVGGYMGEFSKMCLDQGAARAIVLDTHQYEHYGWAEKPLEGVEYVKGDLMDYVPERPWLIRRYYDSSLVRDGIDWNTMDPPDVLILYNLIYHLKAPIPFLERAREIIKPDGTMLLCTLFRYHDGAWVYYYDPKECNPTDESVFFGPSLEALERWLRDTGWEYERVGLTFDRVLYKCKPTREIAFRQSVS